MLKHELEELIRNGESSGVEFKHDDVRPDSLANILIESQNRTIPTVAGLLLFGGNPNRFLPQAGITRISKFRCIATAWK